MLNIITRKNNTNNEQGFTMAEMVVVTAIMGILAAISIPTIVTAGNDIQNKAVSILKVQELTQESVSGQLTPEEEAQLDAYRQEAEQLIGK